MAVQTAELNLLGYSFEKELSLSCSLMNISRGNCNVRIRPINLNTSDDKGILDISIDRPVMKADVNLNFSKFNELSKLMMKDASRPVTVIMLLDVPLSINLAGDLLIDNAAKLKILDLSWVIPLK
tara:strand:- start:21 stop:395 length:375 start_codon:yes stop_codon:yes gene_type:complete